VVNIKVKWDSKKFTEDAMKKINALVEEKKEELLRERRKEEIAGGNPFTGGNPLKPHSSLSLFLKASKP
jgi:hypothetical protein